MLNSFPPPSSPRGSTLYLEALCRYFIPPPSSFSFLSPKIRLFVEKQHTYLIIPAAPHCRALHNNTPLKDRLKFSPVGFFFPFTRLQMCNLLCFFFFFSSSYYHSYPSSRLKKVKRRLEWKCVYSDDLKVMPQRSRTH